MKLSVVYLLALASTPALAVPFIMKGPAPPNYSDSCRKPSPSVIQAHQKFDGCPLVKTDVCAPRSDPKSICESWAAATITNPADPSYTDRCRSEAAKRDSHILGCPLVDSDVCIRKDSKGKCDQWGPADKPTPAGDHDQVVSPE